ncbi:MAG: ATP-binding protein [Planctomycetota bacterium]|jgi:anti-sigma regulatory factor (Ser/Thr protein kinase)
MGDVISRRDIAEKIAEVTEIPTPEVEEVLRALGPVIAQILSEGMEVRFPRLARFMVREREEGASGVRQEILAQVSTLFREKVLGPAHPRVLALLDPRGEAPILNILSGLQEEGICEVVTVANLAEQEKALAAKRYDYLFLGRLVTEPQYRFLAHEIKLDPEKCRTFLFRVVAETTNPYAVDTLTVIPDELIEEPLEPDGVEAVIRSEIAPAEGEGSEYLQQLAIRFPSNEGMTEAAMEVLDRLGTMTPLGDNRQAELMPAVREAVESAIRVGNEGDPSKYVDITFLVDDEKIAVVVKDEGPVPEERGEWAGARGGSGIASMIMKKGADDVEYLPPGNRVMLTKYF